MNAIERLREYGDYQPINQLGYSAYYWFHEGGKKSKPRDCSHYDAVQLSDTLQTLLSVPTVTAVGIVVEDETGKYRRIWGRDSLNALPGEVIPFLGGRQVG